VWIGRALANHAHCDDGVKMPLKNVGFDPVVETGEHAVPVAERGMADRAMERTKRELRAKPSAVQAA
jgi:hypothetical protein